MSNRVATKLRILEVVMAVRFLVAYCLPDSAVVCFPCIETVAEANAGWLFSLPLGGGGTRSGI